MPRNPDYFRDTRGQADSSPFDGQCHREDTARVGNDSGKGEKVG